MFTAGGTFTDPSLGSIDFASFAFNYQKGMIGSSGEPMIDPVTNLPSKFMFSGDPVTHTGWTPDKSGFLNGGDMRSVFSSGPFTMPKGDTQEVVIAFSIARGADNLASITKLRNYSDTIRNAFKQHFAPFINAGQAPHVYYSYDPALLTFPKTFVGATSDTLNIDIANFGKDTLKLTVSAFSTGAFINTASTGDTLKIAGERFQQIHAIFQPQVFGPVTDTLELKTNDPLQPVVRIPLNGTGAKIDPVVPGLIYSINNTGLYTITPSNGMANLITPLESGLTITNLAVQPGTSELFSIGSMYPFANLQLFRVSSNAASSYPSFPVAGYTISGGTSFLNDKELLFASDTVIKMIDVTTGIIDTVYTFLNKHRIKAMSYNKKTNEIFYSLITMLVKPDTADALYKIHLESKQITRVGRVKVGSRVRALLFDLNGKLYGVMDTSSTSHSFFVSIDPATGLGTKIGDIGFSGLMTLAMDPSAPAGVLHNSGTVPETFSLEQNYPNPFNPTTTIRFSVPVSSFITVAVYNVLGQRVKTLTSETRDKGTFELLWDGTDDANKPVASGMYFYRLEAEGTRITKKMQLLR
jgi:hypothetical protein